MARAIGTLGTIDSITVGGRVLTDLTNLITLIASVDGANNHCTFRKPNGTSGYQVPGGKVFTVLGIRMEIGNAADAFDMGYSDNDAGFATTTAFTNPVFFADAGAINQHAPAQTVLPIFEMNYGIGFQVLAAKYLFFASGATMSNYVIAYGYES